LASAQVLITLICQRFLVGGIIVRSSSIVVYQPILLAALAAKVSSLGLDDLGTPFTTALYQGLAVTALRGRL